MHDGQQDNSPLSAGLPGGEARRDSDFPWREVSEILAPLGGHWALPVLRQVAAGTSRPVKIQAALNAVPGRQISDKVMHDVLRRLTEMGLLGRQAEKGEVPPRTYYRLTALGHATLEQVARIDARGRSPWTMTAQDPAPPPGVNTAVPSPARIWNYLVGGKDNFDVDRAAARAAEEAMPSLPRIARHVRLFQATAARRLTAAGVRQFLDIGTGLPVAGSVHEVAQQDAPECRVVYVDNDPLVLTHARALLTSTPQGACAYIDEDLRNPERIMARAAETLDFTQPTAVMLIAVLHFIADDEDPWGIVTRLLDAIPGPAYLALTHAASDLSEGAKEMADAYNKRSPVPIWMRPREEIARFFSGTEMLDPGLVALGDWLPEVPAGFGADADAGHVGIGRRPARRP